MIKIPKNTIAAPFLDIWIFSRVLAGNNMSQPHLLIHTATANTCPNCFSIAFILQCKNILIVIHQPITIFRLHQFTTTFYSFCPILFMHIKFHQYSIGQPFGKAAIIRIRYFISCRKNSNGSLQIVFNEFHHFLPRYTRSYFIRQWIIQQIQRSNLNRTIHIIKDISQPSTSTMQFCIQTCFHFLIHRNIDNTLHSQSHFTYIADISTVSSSQPTGIGCKIHLNHIRPNCIIPLTITDISTHITDDMNTSLRRSIQSAIPIRTERSISGRSHQSLRIFFIFRKYTGINHIIHFRLQISARRTKCSRSQYYGKY